jgi:hypothetical protein
MDATWVTADGWNIAHFSVSMGSGLKRIACGRRPELLDVVEPAGDDVRRCVRCAQSERRLNFPKRPKVDVKIAISTGRLREFVEHLRNTDANGVPRANPHADEFEMGRDSAADELEKLIEETENR